MKVDGEYAQLNANILQIENEYYSFIRPKRVTQSGERPTKALQRAGVQYVEMRSLDVSVFDPVGVNQNKLRFLEAFAAFCVLRDSRPIENSEQDELDGNHAIVAREGRRPGLLLRRDGREVRLSDWAAEIIDSMRGLCELLDEGDAQRPYLTALELQEEKIRDVCIDSGGALVARNAHERGIVLQFCAAHVESPPVLLQGPALPELVQAGRVCRRGGRVDRPAGAYRSVGHAFLRRISRPLFLGVNSG